MKQKVEQIINSNLIQIRELQHKIEIKIDHEGKRLLNKETQPLFRKKSSFSTKEISDIIVNSTAVINKMDELDNCSWDIDELKSQLVNAVSFYDKNISTNEQNIPSKQTSNVNLYAINPLSKFPAQIKTLDGHYVRSKAEMLIDNFLYINNIIHAYERKLPIQEDVYCDFYIPAGISRTKGIYIEYWGLENNPKYSARKNKKLAIYQKYNLNLIELNDPEIYNLEEILTRKLLEYKIEIL